MTPAAAGSDAASGLADDQLDTLVGHIFDEVTHIHACTVSNMYITFSSGTASRRWQASSDALKAFISFGDFQAVMGPTDFQTKLHLPL